MANFVRHEPCPKCGSKDNLARYDDGSAHCFGCKHNIPAGETETRETASPRRRAKRQRPLLTDARYRALPKRGITEETCKFMGYQVGELDGETVHVANYWRDGKIVAQKIRNADKEFTVLGDGKNLPFFGQHLWRGGGRRIVITEGEIDALSVSQLFNNRWPVVSLPQGAHSAAKTCAREIEFLNSFEEIILAFDMDEPGQEAAKEAAAILPPGKVKIAHLPAKDANEALMQGKLKELNSALWEAKPYRPDGVVGVDSVIEKAITPVKMGLAWPWPTLTKVTYGRRRAEVYGLGGGTGCGKTDAFKEVIAHVITVDKSPVGVFFLEEPVAHTVKTIAGKIDGIRYHVPGVQYDVDKLRATIESLNNRIYLYDHFGAMTWSTIKEKIRYMVRALGVRDIFLDHLTALAAVVEDDERKAIDKIMAELAALAQELDCTIYYISHLTTPEGKPHEEGGRVQEKHFRGSRSIAYWSHFLFALERDKQRPHLPSVFRVLKDRYTGDANGVTFGLQYDRETGRTTECELPDEEDDDASPFKKEEETEF